MAKKENKYKGYDITTQAIHTGTDYDEGTGAVRRPLHMANSYKLPDDLSQVNYSSTDLLMYSRNGNPNQHWLEEKVAALHDADDKTVERFCAALKVVTFAVSLGHDESLIFPQPSYDERINLYPEKFRKGFIRFSVGLEDPDDIIADLDQALKSVGL